MAEKIAAPGEYMWPIWEMLDIGTNQSRDKKSDSYAILANDWPPYAGNRANEMRDRRGQEAQALV